jgi:hypothetical protein
MQKLTHLGPDGLSRLSYLFRPITSVVLAERFQGPDESICCAPLPDQKASAWEANMCMAQTTLDPVKSGPHHDV